MNFFLDNLPCDSFDINDAIKLVSIAIFIIYTSAVFIKITFKSIIGNFWFLLWLLFTGASTLFSILVVFTGLFYPQEYSHRLPGYLVMILGLPDDVNEVVWSAGFIAWLILSGFVIATYGLVFSFFTQQGIISFRNHLYGYYDA